MLLNNQTPQISFYRSPKHLHLNNVLYILTNCTLLFLVPKAFENFLRETFEILVKDTVNLEVNLV